MLAKGRAALNDQINGNTAGRSKEDISNAATIAAAENDVGDWFGKLVGLLLADFVQNIKGALGYSTGKMLSQQMVDQHFEKKKRLRNLAALGVKDDGGDSDGPEPSDPLAHVIWQGRKNRRGASGPGGVDTARSSWTKSGGP